jgi:hypothetical protein
VTPTGSKLPRNLGRCTPTRCLKVEIVTYPKTRKDKMLTRYLVSEGQIHVPQFQSLGSFARAIQSKLKIVDLPSLLKRNLDTYLGEVCADSLVLGHCRLHRE